MKLHSSMLWLFAAVQVNLFFSNHPSQAAAQEPAFELPVELVGFPFIIMAVRLSNFVRKLAYTVDPRTYVGRTKRAAIGHDDMIDMIEAEKRLVEELGENVCIYTRVCLHHAAKARKTRGRGELVIDWDEIFRNLTGYALQSRQSYPSSNDISSNFFNPHLLKGKLTAPTNYNPHKSQSSEIMRDVPSVYATNYHTFKEFPQSQYHQPNFHVNNQFSHPINSNYGLLANSKYPHYPVAPERPNYGNYGSLRPQIGYPLRLGPFRPLRPNLDHPQQQGGFLSLLPSRESFMEALDSIARNDELRCVPRILCEVTSGTLSAGRQSGFKLPFNINMESIVGLLSNLNGVDTNPLISFGKAALLGYSSKGNAGTCMYAYPQCPRNPDRLVEYLNNHNGGFFRFFSGLNSQNTVGGFGHYSGYRPMSPQQVHPFDYPLVAEAGSYGLYNPHVGYGYKVNRAEKRILTKPSEFDFTSNRFPDNRQQRGIRFPNDIDEYDNEVNPPNNFHGSRDGDSSRTLRFPIRDEEDSYERPLRKPKRLSDFQYNDVATFQRPLPNHRPTPMIFPDRTGTGELKFTPEELNENYRRPFALQNNNPISFHSEWNNDAFYYINSGSNALGPDTFEFNNQNNRFFP